MSIFDDDRPKKVTQHEIGCDLSLLSADELDKRVALLEAEIVRLKAERAQKDAGRRAAEDFFKR
ncbi:hypothetical protein ASD54_12790 [Rhizobium sp. Root149]|jgi:uncharacterized small protein (DUF1192 family)|uniref:Uncharacterized small protein (DUF1192 family) n=2 Tax=Rhizobium TaxID=379 RepID=A0A7W6LGR8_9HYPH|nr:MULTISPECIES: DUF1192 domain-containing protein [Rhizobium]KQZ49803.1 hypothetical protein ASD54_12790 [Rhizobium sp. Root149]MBB4143882.1 uncharacterized small protein (DUF1192 family) [Rhizobium rhizoryzae]MCJ8509112.1 DUF1192 domain-containing protein [Rhizobium lemnae]